MAKTKKHKVIIPVGIVLLVAIATILIFRAIYSSRPDTPSDGSDSSSSDVATSADAPATTADQQALQEDTPEELPADDDEKPQYEGANPNLSASLDAELTYYGRQADEYLVNINIAQYVSGECQISLGSYHGRIAIDQGVANSACSFHIDPSQLNPGQQKLIVEVTSGTRKGKVEEDIDVSL